MANKTPSIPLLASSTEGVAQPVAVAVKVRNVKSAAATGGSSDATNISPTTGQLWPRGVLRKQ